MRSKYPLATIVALFVLVLSTLATAQESATPISGKSLPKFVESLPILDVAGGTMKSVVFPTAETVLKMCEFRANILPRTFKPANGQPYQGSWAWGYAAGNCPDPNTSVDTYIGPVFVSKRGTPTQIRFVNELPANPQVNWREWTDQSIHWADPLNGERNMCAHMDMATGECAEHYTGPVPTVPHLHGGEIPPVLDGGPYAWFTSDGQYHGHGYYTDPNINVAGNEAVYRYPNTQESAPIWFHDHALGATRINVYSGLAGGYIITDPNQQLPGGLHPVGLQQSNGAVSYTIPLVLQDRQFDQNGQLYYPEAGINPDEHPYWEPEFVGDTIVVNGKAWPVLNVEARRYRFLLINGSNARTYELWLATGSKSGPAIYQIGTDGGYLDLPVKIDPAATKGLSVLRIMPGERADIIIDFSAFKGQSLILRNNGRTPYPKGESPDGSTLGQLLKINVSAATVADTSYNPAISKAPLRVPIVRLANAAGAVAPGVTVNKVRQLTLNEIMGPNGPLEVLINNTKWDGMGPMDRNGHHSMRSDFTPVQIGPGMPDLYSELPQEGTTEVWEIVNLTADAHPIHTHLTQFQLVNRQGFNVKNYQKVYDASFPGAPEVIDAMTLMPYAPGMFIPAFGPPLDYNLGNARALGGNPDVVPFLQGPAMAPDANEAGWKDTIMAPPGTVTRFIVRYAPTYKALNDPEQYFPFDPNAKGFGYVWHCHIIDHEDNEMMRPYAVKSLNVPRSLVSGTDY